MFCFVGVVLQVEDAVEVVEVHQEWVGEVLHPLEDHLQAHSHKRLRHQSKEGLGQLVLDLLAHREHHSKEVHHDRVVLHQWAQDLGQWSLVK